MHTVKFRTTAGLQGLIVLREEIGVLPPYLCGYVRLPMWLWGKELPELEVHGGITYEGYHPLTGPIIKLPRMGIAWGSRWIGFDCAHYEDTLRKCNSQYVHRQCEYLAYQIKQIHKRKRER